MKQKILLLEDDLELHETIKQFLNMKGYEVVSAFDSDEALLEIYEKNIDLMLLDVKVPKLNGFEFLQRVRKTTDTPAIFITSLNSIDDVEKGFEIGCDDYIKKPFSLKELLIRVQSRIKNSYNTHKNRIEIDTNIEFDTDELQLYRDNEKIALKTKELKLLSLFLKYPNKLLSYEEIFDVLWEYGEEPSSGSLRTYIKTLRSVIGKEKIYTIKNRGYRFVK